MCQFTPYYDPVIGRFIAEDPVRTGLNYYTYCDNNPIFFIDPFGLEAIVVSGGVYSSSKQKKGGFYFEFIEPALRTIWDLKTKNPDEQITWFIANAGWTQKNIDAFYAAIHPVEGINIIMMNDALELTNYINSKDVTNSELTSVRTDDKITSFYVFSHGYASEGGTIEFAHDSGVTGNYSLKISQLEGLSSSAFSSDVVSYLYSCNPGTAYENSLAQAWSDKSGGVTYGFVGKSYYGDINKGNKNIWNKWAHFLGTFYWGGSWNLPVAGTIKTPAGESPYLKKFIPR